MVPAYRGPYWESFFVDPSVCLVFGPVEVYNSTPIITAPPALEKSWMDPLTSMVC